LFVVFEIGKVGDLASKIEKVSEERWENMA